MDPFPPYFAGFFDGEGSIGIYRNGRARSHGRTLRVSVTQTATAEGTRLLEDCQLRWGGSISAYNKTGRRPALIHQASAGTAVLLLCDIRPWLRLKAEQADIVMAWWDNRPTIRPRDAQGRMLPFPEDVVERDLLAELALKTAKREGLPAEPIDVVMADAADLVRVDHTLRQVVNVKGN